VDFEGRRSGEIFGRLFAFFYVPQFVVFALAYFLWLIPPAPWTTLASALGLVLVIAAVTLDARRAHLPPTWIVIGAVPFVGWWLYGRRRSGTKASELAGGTSSKDWSTVLLPLRTDRFVLRTRVSPEECAARLRAKTMSIRSPASWFAPSSRVPLQGSATAQRFALKIRHVLTRPSMLDEARGTLRREGDVTTIEVGIGLNIWDRVLALALLVFLSLLSAPFVMSGRPEVLAGVAFLVAMFVFVTFLVRAIGRGDRTRLRRILVETLEALEQ